MIAINELMVGNPVISHLHNGLITEIHSIMPNGVKLWANPLTPCYKFEQISGIPITEDLLLKMGFKLVYKSKFTLTYEDAKEISFDYKFNLAENIQYVSWKGNHITCESVHQLMNIYHALAGHELTL